MDSNTTKRPLFTSWELIQRCKDIITIKNRDSPACNIYDGKCSNHHIQHTSLILPNQQMTQKVTLLTYMIIHETQSIAIKQHDDVCPKDPYWADHQHVLLNLITWSDLSSNPYPSFAALTPIINIPITYPMDIPFKWPNPLYNSFLSPRPSCPAQ